ncbi:hypothetical protein E2C01_038626 [Portunus trituberculatus]|uniref:Uncharacterized protein n=1 Tax=Portunus trituberculatus TaxID=210409 RepID=A0A5B7FKK9_PORTR|nr:hypothetical protein [Portunus trituberculatus]
MVRVDGDETLSGPLEVSIVVCGASPHQALQPIPLPASQTDSQPASQPASRPASQVVSQSDSGRLVGSDMRRLSIAVSLWTCTNQGFCLPYVEPINGRFKGCRRTGVPEGETASTTPCGAAGLALPLPSDDAEAG